MEREYYFCSCRLDEKGYYFIWFFDEEDGVYLNSDGKFAVANDLEYLTKYAEKQSLLITDEEPVFYNLDQIEETLNQPKFKVNCVDFLNAWNLFGDVSNSIKGNFNSDRKTTKKIYEKLFWGNNLPVITPKGKSYEPIWSKKEIEIIREVLLNGIAIFRKNLKYID